MIQFNNLETQSLENICQAFNDAFSDYVVPLQITLPLMQMKLRGENLQLSYSIGGFDNGQLVAFILHGTDDTTPHSQRLYNGGTGVIPTHRGQKLVQQMYEQAIPAYRNNGIRELILEVITTNTPAIKAYHSCGFEQSRIFHCYKGNIKPIQPPAGLTIQPRTTPDWPTLTSFGDQLPSWSNDVQTILREGDNTTTWIAEKNNETVGFISVFTGNNRIRQIAVHPDFRRQGIGTALLSHVAGIINEPLSIINVEASNTALQQCLLQSGFSHTISQYEMIKAL